MIGGESIVCLCRAESGAARLYTPFIHSGTLGGLPVQLTHGGSYDPSESPDGHYLYYGSVFSWNLAYAARAPVAGWKPG